MAQQIAPPAKGMSALDYYNTLTSQGLRPYDAYNAVQASFGPPKTPQQQAEDAASAEQLAGIGQTVGQIGGLIGTNYALGQLGASAGAGAGTAAGAGAAGTAGAATAGTAGAGAGTAATGSTLSTIGSVALPVAIGAAAASTAWESGMKDIVRGRGNRADYINQAANLATGFVPNLALNLMGKPSIGRKMTSGKSDAQLLRDDFRGKLQQTGVADEDYNVTLASGEKYNIGKDGKAKLTNVDQKTTRRTWDVDFANPLAKYAVNIIDPKVRSVYTAEADAAGIPVEQYTGMLVNAATSNAKTEQDVLANINAMLGKSGIDKPATRTETGISAPLPPRTSSAPILQPISTRPPAPLPPSTSSAPIAQPSGKKSIRDILQSNMNK